MSDIKRKQEVNSRDILTDQEILNVDTDFSATMEVYEQQTWLSRASRKYWIVQKWLNGLFIYQYVMLSVLALLFCFAVYHHYNKPSPIILFEFEDGTVTCAKAFSAEKDGELFLNYTKDQRDLCRSLKKYGK